MKKVKAAKVKIKKKPVRVFPADSLFWDRIEQAEEQARELGFESKKRYSLALTQ